MRLGTLAVLVLGVGLLLLLPWLASSAPLASVQVEMQAGEEYLDSVTGYWTGHRYKLTVTNVGQADIDRFDIIYVGEEPIEYPQPTKWGHQLEQVSLPTGMAQKVTWIASLASYAIDSQETLAFQVILPSSIASLDWRATNTSSGELDEDTVSVFDAVIREAATTVEAEGEHSAFSQGYRYKLTVTNVGQADIDRFDIIYVGEEPIEYPQPTKWGHQLEQVSLPTGMAQKVTWIASLASYAIDSQETLAFQVILPTSIAALDWRATNTSVGDFRSGVAHFCDDTTPPQILMVEDEGNVTSSTTQLTATWDTQDDESEIVECQYAIGTTPGAFDVVNWTGVGQEKTITRDGLPLVAGVTYYFAVKARNCADLWSEIAISDGITVQPTTINVLMSWSVLNLTAGSQQTTEVTVRIMDAQGNPVTGSVPVLTLSPQNGTLSPVTHQGGGIYTATYTAGNTPGDVTVIASVPGGESDSVALKLLPADASGFQVTTANPEASARPGDTVTYLLLLEAESDQDVTLFETSLPADVSATFEPKQVHLGLAQGNISSQLTLSLDPDIAPGVHSFTVLAVPDRGETRQLQLSLTVTEEIYPTTLTLRLQPQQAQLMQSVNALGELFRLDEDTIVGLPDATIRLTFTRPEGEEDTFEARTDASGAYQLISPFLADQVGTWQVTARFEGQSGLGESERSVSLEVTQGSAQIVFESETVARLGQAYLLLGRLTPQLADASLSLKLLRPNGSAAELGSLVTQPTGVFEYEQLLDQPGDWQFTLTWSGDGDYQTVSATHTVTVPEEMAKAIVVLGGAGPEDNHHWSRFNLLAEYVHESLVQRTQDPDEDIYFLSPEPTATKGADSVTSKAALQFAITDWAAKRVNAQIPLFLYLLSHNLGDAFLLEQEQNHQVILTSTELAGWLDVLPAETSVTVIIEACYSGRFIQTQSGIPTTLVAPNRAIFASAHMDQQAAILSGGVSFTKAFFEQIKQNQTLDQALKNTESQMRRHKALLNQFPQLEADGDGIPNSAQDRAIVSQRYLPSDILKLVSPPDIIDITPALTLPEGVSSLLIEVGIEGSEVERVTGTVIPPDYDPSQPIDDWSALTFDEFSLVPVDVGRYAGTYRGFTQAGEYTIIVSAENPDGSAIPVQTTITVPHLHPWDVTGDGMVDVLDLVAVGSQYGQQGTQLRGDINGDGSVDISDLVLIGQHFGENVSSGAPAFVGGTGIVPDRLSLLRALSCLESMAHTSPDTLMLQYSLRRWLQAEGWLVRETRLWPNYPNPFNPETWIPYELATDEVVVLRIFSSTGQMVRKLDLGHQPAGSYLDKDSAAYWDGCNHLGERVGSGIYLYQLRAGEFTAIQRMVVLK